jgi:hypothetical protein
LPEFDEIYLLPKDERVLFFRAASEIMNIPMEKFGENASIAPFSMRRRV